MLFSAFISFIPYCGYIFQGGFYVRKGGVYYVGEYPADYI